jgi:predicted Zn-dependent protease with MMP-like domain
VAEALEQLPEEFRPYLDNVEILIEEDPEAALLDRLGVPDDETLYGLYVGTPLTERGHDPAPLPDRILLFRGPLMDDFEEPEELRREVAITVLHEIAHHFGIDEERLRELGY